ncbi:hypothetical protein COY07_03615 [Candidatus Peregrinibacteria bacterium CG_4_10_14_0_2_um_filter_43_11]|nr:MAG: hypothetical protein COY07_03615 [Candidatus Peregrinibacteria bacterium CG_4_10_14_0_2_um_filter_43_11]
MKLFYLVSAVIITVFILILSFAQVGATCTWYLFKSSSPAFLILLELSALGAVVGGLLVLFWKTPAKTEGEDDENMSN